jgi:hypothetical protein
MSWCGWVFTLHGLSISDRVRYKVKYTEETMPATISSVSVSVPQTVRYTSAAAKDLQGNVLEKMVSVGLNAYSLVGQAINFGAAAMRAISQAVAGSGQHRDAPLVPSEVVGGPICAYNPELGTPHANTNALTLPSQFTALRLDEHRQRTGGAVIIPQPESKEDYIVVSESTRSSSAAVTPDMSASTILLADQARAISDLRSRLASKK